MLIYWSMILWILLFYGIYALSRRRSAVLAEGNMHQGIQKKIPWLYAILVFSYIIFWVGIRKYVADTTAYIMSFNAIPTDFNEAWASIDWEGKAPGFEVFNVIFKSFVSKDFTAWLMTIAIISGVCIMVTLRNHSIDFFFSSYLFITTLGFYWMINGMRQFICASVLFACCKWIRDGKIFRFIFMVLLLSTIHLTAVMMIPLYFVARMKPWSYKAGLFIIGILLISIFAEPFFSSVDNALSDTAYAGSTAQFEEDDGVNPLRVLFFLVPPVIAFWKRKKLVAHYEENKLLPIMINMSLATASLYFVGVFTSGILIGRLPIYSELYNLLLIPYLIKVVFNERERRILQPAYMAVCLLFFSLVCDKYYHSILTGTVY